MSIEADEVMATEWCESCDTVQPLTNLVEVVTVGTSETFWVCRPSVLGSCFRRGVASVHVHRIRQTLPPDGSAQKGAGVDRIAELSAPTTPGTSFPGDLFPFGGATLRKKES